MKKSTHLLYLLISIISAAQLPAQNLSNGLQACYPLDGNTTNYAPSGNLLNGLPNNVISSTGHTGLPGTAYSLTGSIGSYLRFPSSTALKSDSVFFSGWFYIDSLPYEQYLVYTKNNCAYNFEAYSLITYYDYQYGQQTFRVSKSGAACQYAPQVVSTTAPAVGNWYHVCFYVDNSVIKLYVNGVLEASANHNVVFSYQAGKDVFIGVTNESNFNLPFKGRVDDVRFYNRPLTATEVLMLYNQSPACVISPGSVPVAAFQTSTTRICTDSIVTFMDQSSNNPNTWNWQMPGGTPSSSSLLNPSVTYSAAGIYTVYLVATNTVGTSTNTAVQTITVDPCIRAEFAPSMDHFCVGATVSLADLSLGSPSGWMWQMPGGSPATSTISNPSVTYASPGVYSIYLTAYNSQVSSNTVVHTLTVFPCVSAAFQMSQNQICVGGSVALVDQSAGGPTGWLWQTPGGNPSSSGQVNPTVNYSLPGLYQIYLTTYNAQGTSTNTAMQTLTVSACLGTEEYNSSHSYLIYPNPCEGVFLIQGKEVASVRVADASGRCLSLFHFMSQESLTQIELKGIADGLYIVEICDANGRLLQREKLQVIK